MTPDQIIVSVLDAKAIVAPISPPIKAWDELLGIPKYHVMRFQIIAADRAEIITYCGRDMFTKPLDMV